MSNPFAKGQLPPVRAFEIELVGGNKTGIEGHGFFIDESGALSIRRYVISMWAQGNIVDQIVKMYAPGTWLTATDVSQDFGPQVMAKMGNTKQ